MTATIIAFPRPPAPEDAAGPLTGQARLAQAMDRLRLALAEQREAVAQWRQSLSELRDATQSLGESLTAYRARMADLGNAVAGVGEDARRLERWAERVSTPNDRHAVVEHAGNRALD